MSAAHVRLPPRRSGLKLWTMRVLGLLATSALLAVGATAVMTFAPQGDRASTALTEAAPAATSKPHPAKRGKGTRKPRLTRAQLRARKAAVVVLRDRGYRPVSLADYAPGRVLRVLIGRGEAGRRAFFFAGGRFVGTDSGDDSLRVEVARTGNRSVALAYRVFAAGDEPCCPSRSERVLFRWDGKRVEPQTSIPAAGARRRPS